MKPNRPKDSKPAPVGDLLPKLDHAGQPLVHDADREPDFAGPAGPAKFSKQPSADQNPAAYGYAQQDDPEPAGAATRQPDPSTMPSPTELPPLSAGLDFRRQGRACSVQLDPMWFERLQKLSERAGLDPTRFVEELIKQKWVLGPMAHPAPR